jgi:protein TonB
MEIKKNPNVDLQNKRILLYEISFAVALLAAIGALLYTTKDNKIEQIVQEVAIVEEEITEITRQDIKQPEPIRRTEIKVFSDALSIVTNDEKITTNVDFNEFSEDMSIDVMPQVKPVVEEVIEDDQPFVKVEKMPSFKGGDLMTFRNWVMERIRYPQIAQENNITGRVLVQFVIERDGTLTNIQVLQTPDSSLSDEAIRVLKTSPKWTPGKQGNKMVRVKYTLPVEFRIQN